MLHPDMQILKILQLINNRYLYLEPTVHEPVNRNILIYSFLSLSLSLPLSLFSEPLDSLLFETLLSQLFTCSVLEGFVWIFLRFFFFFWCIWCCHGGGGVVVVVRWVVAMVVGCCCGGEVEGAGLWISVVKVYKITLK